MDHIEAREELEVAAVEPGGIDRLMAGDTAVAQAVAGHLAGCPSCTDELTRLRRASAVLREVVRTTVPPELRGRALAYVGALGRDRSGAGQATDRERTDRPPATAHEISALGRRRSSGGPARLGSIAAAAAAVALAVISTNLLLGSRVDSAERTIAALQRITSATVDLSATADARVSLADMEGAGRRGTILFSSSTTNLVIVVTGLAPPPAGREYRCWLESSGRREKVGRMFFAGDLAFWAGPVPAVAGIVSDTTFGVSLVDAGGEGLEGDPVLAGQLGEG